MANAGYKLSDADKESLYADAKAGMGPKELGEKYKLSASTAGFHRRNALGIPQPPSYNGKGKGKIGEPGARKLTDEKKQLLYADMDAGMRPVDIGKKYGISSSVCSHYNKRWKAMRKSTGESPKIAGYGPELLAQMNADILAKMPDDQLKKKYNIGKVGIRHLRARIETTPPKAHVNGKRTEAPSLLDDASIDRLMGMLSRLAKRHPDIFADVNPIKKLATKYPQILLEVL